MTLSQKIRKILLGVAAVIGFAALLAQAACDNTFVSYPRVPDPAIGRTVPYVAKRVLVYITEDWSTFLDWLRWIEISSFSIIFISLFVNLKWPLPSK